MLPFDRARFSKVLAVTLTVMLVGFVLAIVIQGTIATHDVIGSIISAVILAYLVHLWTMPSDDDSANR